MSENELLHCNNDYTCISDNDADDIKQIGHYTNSAEVVKSILQGNFWATDMSCFRHPNVDTKNKTDVNEGVLIFQNIREILQDPNDKSVKCLPESFREKALEKIKDQLCVDQFIGDHRTHVISFCKNIYSSYMWEHYAKEGYELVFNKAAFVKEGSLSLVTPSGRRNEAKIFNHAPIVYDHEKQMAQIEQFIQKYGKNLDSDTEDDDYFVGLFLRHLMYVGNFYKTENDFHEEEEYRLLVNSISPDRYVGSVDHVPIEEKADNGKDHIVISYDPRSIDRILCKDEICMKTLFNELRGNLPEDFPTIEIVDANELLRDSRE